MSKRLMVGLLGVAACIGGCAGEEPATALPPVKTAVEPSDSATAEAATGSEAAAGEPGMDVSLSASASEASNQAGRSGQPQAFDGMKFTVPANWKQLALSPMQTGIVAAKFGIPEISENITLTLSTSGGSVEDNIRRWEGQFSGGESPVRETISADGKDATVVRLHGDFSAGFGKSTEQNWRMIGVIIPMTSHNYFIKLTGPEADVSRAEDQFLAFCRSARRE